MSLLNRTTLFSLQLKTTINVHLIVRVMRRRAIYCVLKRLSHLRSVLTTTFLVLNSSRTLTRLCWRTGFRSLILPTWLVGWTFIKKSLCSSLVEPTSLTIVKAGVMSMAWFKFLTLKWFIFLLWDGQSWRCSSHLVVWRIHLSMNYFDTIHITSHHCSSLSLFTWSNSVCSTRISNLTFSNMNSLKLLTWSRIVIKTICLVISLRISIKSVFRIINERLAIPISTELLYMLGCSFVMWNNLIDLILLQHWNHLPTVVCVVLYFSHTCCALPSSRVLLLVYLNNLSLLLNSCIGSRIETAPHIWS